MDKLMRLVVAVQLRLMGAVEEKEQGATATEYALLVALIAIVIAVAVGFFGSQLSLFFNRIGSTVQNWAS
jgi:pilus assembly protein Flp/PilA